MVNRGFSEVYQLDGGIVRYGEAYGNRGLWEGSLYVFDGRESTEFGPDAAVVGRCASCGTPESRMVNCTDEECRRRVVCCAACGSRTACESHRLTAAAS